MNGKTGVIILAAGKGVRMDSDLPKVLHKLDQEPLVNHVLKTVHEAGIRNVYLVVGHKADRVKRECKMFSKINFVHQKEQLGTGHAVMQAEPVFDKNIDTILILNGDTPLIRKETLKGIIDIHNTKKSAATLLTSDFPNPKGYGRIIRSDDGMVVKIVEDKDAKEEELAIKEINTGIYCFDRDVLFSTLKEIKSENKQGEYYLTDAIEILKKKKAPVFAYKVGDSEEVVGVNTKEDLISVYNILRKRKLFLSPPVHVVQRYKVVVGVSRKPAEDVDLSFLALSGVIKTTP